MLRAVPGAFCRDVQSTVIFHLTQSTWDIIQKFGLVNEYNENEDFQLFCGKLNGLVFLPADEVPKGMMELKDKAPTAAMDLVSYFDKTYIVCQWQLPYD